MEDRRQYDVSLLLTDDEARMLLETAARRGQGIGAFLSGIVADIHHGHGDEGGLIYQYLDKSEPVTADSSFVAFCLRHGHEVDALDDISHWIDETAREAEDIRADIEAGVFPESKGWKPGATVADAMADLQEVERTLEELRRTRGQIWAEYQKEAAYPMTEDEALEEARAYQRMEDEWLSDND